MIATDNKTAENFKKIKSLRCLIIGDVMVDAYIWGAVNRISPEAPVPVFEVKKRENRLGGAANVALNVQSLGATPILCGVIGEDDKGKVFQQLLSENDLVSSALVIDKSRVTTCKTRIISASHHLLRVDEEELSIVSESVQKQVFLSVQKEIDKGIDVIIFEDYDKGLLTDDLIRNIVTVANKKGIPTCVDPKKNNFYAYKGVSLFKPNFKEFIEGLNVQLLKNDFKNIGIQAKLFLKNSGINSLLITLSEHGMLMVDDEEEFHVKALVRNIADVSGAGDTVISTAALALAAGFSKKQVVQLANLAGGLVCEEIGVVPVQIDKLKSEFSRLYI